MSILRVISAQRRRQSQHSKNLKRKTKHVFVRKKHVFISKQLVFIFCLSGAGTSNAGVA